MCRKLVLTCLVLASLGQSAAHARERYMLAYWRELGHFENNGCLYMRIWAMRQDGALLPNVKVLDQNGYQLAVTEASGRVDITFDRVTEPVQLQVTDDRGRASDLTPVMCTQRYPAYGTYSYEMLFILQDENTPGVFDTRLYGTVNLPGETNSDAPCTRSLAYRSTDPYNRTTDSFNTAGWTTEHGQTFVADGDRVRAVMMHGAIGGTSNLIFTVDVMNQVGGSVIASGVTPSHSGIDPWIVGFGENSCPLISGQSYYVRMTRPEGLTAYVMSNNVYPNGSYVVYGNLVEANDIKGLVCCEKVGASVTCTFSGTVRDSSGQPLSGAIVTVDSSYRKTTSAANGTFSVGSLLPGTYTLRVFRQGYTTQEFPCLAIEEGQNVQIDPVLYSLSANAVQNPGFETGLFSPWVKTGVFAGVSSTGTLSVPSHSGSYWAGRAVQNGSGFGWAYQVMNVVPGVEYTASCFIYTDSYSSFLRTYEYPTNCKGRIGLDPTGGTDPYSTSIIWGPITYSHNAWSPTLARARATGSTMTVFVSMSQVLSKPYNVVAFDDFHVGAANPTGKLRSIQAMPDGTHVDCFGQVTTASTAEMGGACYVEEPDRTRGVRVVTAQTIDRGKSVAVSGVIRTVNGERVIEAESVTVTGNASVPGTLGISPSRIVERLSQVSGLLVRTWGSVIERGTGYIVISDGAGSLKVYTQASVDVGLFVRVTGVMGTEILGGAPVGVLRCRAAGDVVVEP